ncbi:MAG: SusC/RagA family TonB-linked outer membrane protein [Chitinophagaceae bacterium]
MKRILLVMCSAAAFTALSPAGANASGSNHRAYFQQQDKVVTGKVTDEKGAPLADATVAVKDHRISTVTKADGTFTITVPSTASALLVSYIGMTDKEIDVKSGTDFSIAMNSTSTSMDDIVVIGYGSQKRGRLNYAATSINMKEVEDLPVGNLGAALAGRLLGVSVSGGTSRPGSPAQLVIRNPSSLSKDGGTNGPLYVIDDVIQITAQGAPNSDLFNSLDPTEVESITFLKDAGAAIYGSRGANGVVVVTTKRGKAGKPRITYSGSYGINDAAYHTKMLNAYELGRYINIINGPSGANANNTDNRYFFSDDELEHFKTINHNWLDQAWQSSSTMRHTMNLSGGADKATYFASVTNYKQDGNLGRLIDNKWTFRGGTDVNISDAFKVGLQVSGNIGKDSRVNSRIGGTNVENDYRILLRAPRYIPTYLDGYPVKLPGPGGNNVSAYHLFEMDRLNNYNNGDRNALTVNAYMEYSVPFIQGLKLRGSYGRNSSSTYNESIGTRYPLYTFANMQGDRGHIYEGATGPTAVIAQNHNRIIHASTRASSYQANFSMNYARQFGEHSISAFLTAERSEAEGRGVEAYKEAPVDGTNGQFNTAFGTVDGSTSANETGTLGYIGRVGYAYSSRYTFDFLFRTDASTKFAPENYWGKFYSIGTGWVVSDEKFFKSSIFDYLKVRYSLGLLGKDDTRPWQWRQRYTFQNGKGGSFGSNNQPAGIGMKMEASPNRDATWSNDTKQNLGIDARFLKSRLSLGLDVFYSAGRNLLAENTNVPVTVGGTVAAKNFASVNSFGYEVGLGWNERLSNDFSYGIDFRFSWMDNKVLDGNFNEQESMFPWNERPNASSDIGTWGYQYLGMFKSQDDINNYVQKYGVTSMLGLTPDKLFPGMLYYADVRGPLQDDGTFAGPDGIVNEFDQIRLSRKSSNHYSFGTTLRASYKGLSFDCVIGGSFGGWAEMDAFEPLQRDLTRLFQSAPAYWADMWDPVLNPNGKYPNAFYEETNSVLSSFWGVNSFRLRMVNATLSYSLPKKIVNAAKISNARFVLSALNPLNLYNPYSYKNSEGSWDSYPVLRTLSLGVNVTF